MADGDLLGADPKVMEPPKGAPQGDGSKPVTQEDLNKFRSAYDTIIEGQNKKLQEAERARLDAAAELKLMKESASEDTLKVVQRERDLQTRSARMDEAEKVAKAREHKMAAREIAHEAKSAWGVEVKPEELEKLPDQGAMAIAVMRLVTQPDKQPAKQPPRFAVPLKGPGGATPTYRYETSNMDAAVEEFLRGYGVIS